VIGCQGSGDDIADPADRNDPDPTAIAATDHLKEIFDQVDGARLTQTMRELSGVVPVVVNGQTITLGQRFNATGRKNFRDYWTQTMRNLGLEVNQLHYQAAGHPRAGDNVEAVLRGPSPSSVVVIVHYDSIGPRGQETSNPGADDDMSGMSIQLETARLLVQHKAQIASTVRFVASDEEELGGIAGARNYAAHIKALSQTEGFTLLAAVDDEQSGWNCSRDGLCGDNLFPAFDVFQLRQRRRQDLQLPGDRRSAGQHHQHVLDAQGQARLYRREQRSLRDVGDRGARGGVLGAQSVRQSALRCSRRRHLSPRIDMAYLTSIARPAITFQASLAGVLP